MSRHPSLPRRRPRLAAMLIVAPLLPGAALACPSSLASVDVYDRNEQRSLDVYRHRGRQYVIGQPGHEYAVRIRNCSVRRVLAVVSVDGVNVVTGETAAPDQSGYVIEAGGYVNIEGWRKDLSRTAAFYFSDPGDAYAARTGRPENLGVIGVALFREREPRWPAGDEQAVSPPSAARQESAAAEATANRDAAKAASPSPSLGTGHGRGEYSPARRVEFERAGRHPEQRVVIRYNRHDNLVAMGVLPRPSPAWREPDPFPGTFGFVPDP